MMRLSNSQRTFIRALIDVLWWGRYRLLTRVTDGHIIEWIQRELRRWPRKFLKGYPSDETIRRELNIVRGQMPTEDEWSHIVRLRKKYDLHGISLLSIVEMDATPIDKNILTRLGLDGIIDRTGRLVEVHSLNLCDRYTRLVIGSEVYPRYVNSFDTLMTSGNTMLNRYDVGLRWCQPFEELRLDMGGENPHNRLNECVHVNLGTVVSYADAGAPGQKANVERSHDKIARRLKLKSDVFEVKNGDQQRRFYFFDDFVRDYKLAIHTHNSVDRSDRRAPPLRIAREMQHELRRVEPNRIIQGICWRVNNVNVLCNEINLYGVSFGGPELEMVPVVDVRLLMLDPRCPAQIYDKATGELLGTFIGRDNKDRRRT